MFSKINLTHYFQPEALVSFKILALHYLYLFSPSIFENVWTKLRLSRFSPLIEHVSSKLFSSLNCLISSIYTSQYLARVLLPSQFYLSFFVLSINYFLILHNPSDFINTVCFLFLSFLFSLKPFPNSTQYSNLLSCRLHSTHYSFVATYLSTMPLEIMYFFFCRFVFKGGNRDSCATTMICKSKSVHDLAALFMLAHLSIFLHSSSCIQHLNLHEDSFLKFNTSLPAQPLYHLHLKLSSNGESGS